VITIDRSRDYALIKSLAIHPAIFPHISDDFTCDPQKWQPPENELIRYLIASDDQGAFGFGIFLPENSACWKAHFGFLPRSYGAKALTSFKAMLRSIWATTPAARIVGEICRDNRRAIRFAERAGCEIYGVNSKSIVRGGTLRDLVCLGISKPV